MPRCIGLNAIGTKWEFVTLEVASAATGDVRERGCFVAPNESVPVPSLFAELDKWVTPFGANTGFDPRAFARIDPNKLLEQLSFHMQADRYSHPYDEYRESRGRADLIGVCHPYATPPLVRTLLPVLFDEPPLKSHFQELQPRPSRSIPEDGQLYIADTPVCACCELIVRGLLAESVSLVILSGAGGKVEVTRVQVLRQADSLKLDIVDSFEVGQRSDSEVVSSVLPDGHDERETESLPQRIIAYGDGPRSLAQEMARCWPSLADGPELRADSQLAFGAAMYAVFCGAGSIKEPAGAVTELTVSHRAPRAIGILGTNGSGEWFYRQILSQGQPHTGAHASIQLDGPIPERIIFGECARDSADTQWLARDQWAQVGLRWSSTWQGELPGGTQPTSCRIAIANPSGDLAYGLSEQRVNLEIL